MKRLVVAVGLATLLGPLAVSTGVQAQTLPELPAPIPTVSITPVPTIFPEPTPAPVPSLTPEPSPTPSPTSIAIIPQPVKTVVEQMPSPVKTVVQSSPTPVPGPIRTVFVPGPTRTIFVPGPTRTVVVERVVIRQGPVVRVTVDASPQVTPSPTVVYRHYPGDDEDIDLSTPEAIGISVGLVALGIVLALLALFLVYGLGWKEAEDKEKRRLADLNDELFGR